MTHTDPTPPAMPSSLVDIVGRHHNNLAVIPSEQLQDWLAGLPVPPNWHVGQIDNAVLQPSRVAVYGPLPQGGWAGCETLSAFRFTGHAPIALVIEHSDRTLRDLHADSMATYRLDLPSAEGVAAVRSSGYLTAAGRRVWAQYSTYVRNEMQPFDGLLLYQTLVIDSARRAELRDDIGDLSDAVHAAFMADIDTVKDENQPLYGGVDDGS
jgi:hypothetical protein